MLSLSNLQYFYDHLPARLRRDDESLFLKRFLSFFGEQLDGFDLQLDTFYRKIDPQTAAQSFIDWWLYSLFGWGWFPEWFTEDRRRAFYAAITQHYARRGTVAGIKSFLAAFGLRVIVEHEPRMWGDTAWGASLWTVTAPLGIVVRLLPDAPAIADELEFWSEATFGEAIGAAPGDNIQRADLDELLRFVWPLGNIIMVEDLPFQSQLAGEPLTYGEAEYGEEVPG
jgi:phage tail-like protein